MPADAFARINWIDSGATDDVVPGDLYDPEDVEAARVLNRPSMVGESEILRRNNRRSTAQASTDMPLYGHSTLGLVWDRHANAAQLFVDADFNGLIVDAPCANSTVPNCDILSTNAAELFALACSQAVTSSGQLEPSVIPEHDPSDEYHEFEAWIFDADEHQRWQHTRDTQQEIDNHETEVLAMGGQPSSSSTDAASQTEFIQVLEPLQRLRSLPVTEADRPDVYAFLKEGDLN